MQRLNGLSALGRFAAEIDLARLPAAIVEKAKACLLYAMAVGLAGMRSRQAREAAEATLGNPEGGGTSFFDDRALTPGDAAFANATLFHARVQDDAHPAGHVGVVVAPTALAMAEAAGTGGGDMLAAIVAGYEVALRIGRDHATDSSTRGFRTTPIYGVFGAAAVAGRLLELDQARMTHALALAANMAGGLRDYSDAGSEDFPFQAGTAARNGITAALLAQAGATSAPSALDGKAGFFRAYGEAGRRYDARLAEGLGAQFEIAAVTYKPYPICQFHRGLVRGSAALRERAGGRALTALTARMHPFEADFYGVRFAGPFKTFPQTFMSATFCAALGWTRGTATYADLIDFAAPDVLDVVQRTRIVADPARARYAPMLEARLADGASIEWEELERADVYLLTWETARAMTRTLGQEAGMPAAALDRLIATVSALDAGATAADLISGMRDASRTIGRDSAL